MYGFYNNNQILNMCSPATKSIFYFSFFYSKVTKDGKNLEMLLLSIFTYILLKEEP